MYPVAEVKPPPCEGAPLVEYLNLLIKYKILLFQWALWA